MAKTTKKEETAEVQTIGSEDIGNIDEILAPALDGQTDGAAETPGAQTDDAASETKEPETAQEEKPADAPKLLSLSELADKHRVASWRQAALLRYMGWEDDKMVSEADYKAALTALENRRIGGGRK